MNFFSTSQSKQEKNKDKGNGNKGKTPEENEGKWLLEKHTSVGDLTFLIIFMLFNLPFRGEEASRAGGPDVPGATADPLHHSDRHEPAELHKHQRWEHLLE